MKYVRVFALLFMLASLVNIALLRQPCSSFAQSNEISIAPFGLSWGLSTEQVKQLGINLKEVPDSTFGKSFGATRLPSVLSDQEETYLFFGYDDKLWRVVAVSRPFGSDPTGTSVRSRYNDLANLLGEKYGKPEQFHRLGDSIYKEPNYFLAGIREGRTHWTTFFRAQKVDVQIGITVDDSTTSRWRMIYEDKTLSAAFQASRRGKEKGAL